MNKFVLITGASKGLGFSLAEKLIEKNFFVVATYRKKKEFLSRLEKNPNIKLLKMDVSSELSVKNTYHKIKKLINHIDILINNAAIYIEGQKPNLPSIENIDIKKALLTYNVNSLGVLRVLKYFYPLVEKGKEKKIINISSEAGSITNCWRDREFGYSMSKAALNMISAILINYSKDKGIKVYSIHPGWMRTDMGGKEADISANESADGIINLIDKMNELKSGFYDYQGNPMPW